MINTCLFPAAGYGTRFLPATKSLPKEMLPVLTKPLIHYGVDEAREAGMKNMAFVTGRGKRALEDYFDISYELEHQISGTSKESLLSEIRNLMNECSFTFTRQSQMLGLGHAIYSGKNLVGDEPFGVILADDLCINPGGIGVMKQMSSVFEKYRCSIVAVMEVKERDISKYGVISGKNIDDNIIMVENMVEKPDPKDAPSNLAIIGRYILTPNIFSHIKASKPGKNGEIQITDALLSQAKDGIVIAYKFKGKRFDCGSIDGFVEATNYFYSLTHKKSANDKK
ncbi:MAG: UTP--glucose-1-phosphate uridylyltransferase GalU [Campylobacter sp.]|nr:UTP--glucose-1-phosphate uridylyltransferase GalU [Campylobacter sp.]